MNLELIGLIIAVLGCYFSIRSENKKDREIAAADRKDLLNMMRNQEKETRDFHGRLCALEEKYIQMMQRFMHERK